MWKYGCGSTAQDDEGLSRRAGCGGSLPPLPNANYPEKVARRRSESFREAEYGGTGALNVLFSPIHLAEATLRHATRSQRLLRMAAELHCSELVSVLNPLTTESTGGQAG